MKENKNMKTIQLNNIAMSIVIKPKGCEIARYRISPYASFMTNAELASDIMEAYEKYYHSIRKDMNT